MHSCKIKYKKIDKNKTSSFRSPTMQHFVPRLTLVTISTISPCSSLYYLPQKKKMLIKHWQCSIFKQQFICWRNTLSFCRWDGITYSSPVSFEDQIVPFLRAAATCASVRPRWLMLLLSWTCNTCAQWHTASLCLTNWRIFCVYWQNADALLLFFSLLIKRNVE